MEIGKCIENKEKPFPLFIRLDHTFAIVTFKFDGYFFKIENSLFKFVVVLPGQKDDGKLE